MYARVTDVQVSRDKIDEGITSFQDQVLKVAKDADGYRAAFLLVDRSSGKAIGMTLWESEENRNQADAVLREVRANTLQALGVDPSTVPDPDLYEVAVSDLR